jgi:hypothetical protein
MRYCILSLLFGVATAGAVFLAGHVTGQTADPAPAAAVVRSVQSGAWSDAKTWDGGNVPGAGVKVLIRAGHAVRYDVKSDAVLRSLHIGGTLYFAHDRDTLLNVGLVKIQHGETLDESGFDCLPHPKDEPAANGGTAATAPGLSAPCLCCDGKPALLVGTPEQPIDSRYTAMIRLHYIDGMDKESCPAIVCCGGRMDFHGAPLSRTWVRLGADVTPRKGAVGEITLAEPVTGWKAGDRLIVTTSGRFGTKGSSTEETTIKTIDGTRVVLEQPLTLPHSGSGDHRSEVANLSRNVIVESANPDGLRGHTMYHRKSAGSISYAEFRHLGKEGVLGRYSLHFHMCGDTMRGSSIVGASIHHSKNRWITIHGTNYLVVRDCVGYQSTGHGFFLEDGTEVYNVLDRNLACQALEGKPLPRQVLPFDKNDGAGFWWANSQNTITRNVAVECKEYGFRYDASPRAGVVVAKTKYGEPGQKFDLVMNIRQPDGSRKAVDIRTMPFVRFEDNESHGHGFWGLNMGVGGVGGVGPDASTPFVIRNLKIWGVFGGFGVEAPNILIDGMTVDAGPAYAIRDSVYVAQDYRKVTFTARNQSPSTVEEYLAKGSLSRVRQPGWPMGNGDGGAKLQSSEVEVAKLNPVDKLPPQTVITHVRADGSRLLVRGNTADDGSVKRVLVNGQEARLLSGNHGEWQVTLDGIQPGLVTLSAHAEDEAGNVEITKHELAVVLR